MKSGADRISSIEKILKIDIYKKKEFQDILDLVASLCGKPVALIALLDDDFNWLKVKPGEDVEVIPQETSFNNYVIDEENLLIVPDTTADDRFKTNPLVSSEPYIRFYAGVPIVIENGIRLGTLCIYDTKPNWIDEKQQETLKLFARQVSCLLELELGHKELQYQIAEKDAKNNALMKVAQLQSHQIRQPLTTIMSLISLFKDEYPDVDREWLTMFEQATNEFDVKIKEIVAESIAVKDLRAIRFNKMVEEIDDYAILLLDKNGKVENWNKGAEKIKGYTAEEIIGKHFSVFYSEYDQNNLRPQRLLSHAEKKGVAKDEGWRIRKDGSRFWGSIIMTAIHDDYGEVIGFTKVTRDLTDITDTRDALCASEELYKYLLLQTQNSVSIGGWELNIETNILHWTAITKSIHGVDSKYVPELENAINFYKQGYSRDSIKRVIELTIAEGIPWDLELQIITEQGNEKWVRATGSSNYKDGICTKIYGTFQDIDESKREKIETSKSQKLFEDILNTPIGIGVFATDINGIVIVFNKEAERMLGYTADEVIGKHSPGLFLSCPDKTKRGKRTGIKSLPKIQEMVCTELRNWTYVRKDSSEIQIQSIFTPLRDADNNIYGYIGIAVTPTSAVSRILAIRTHKA
ncbi:PAS domain S-box protein [Chitinophaga sp. LS1]|uniref:PAS domain S-box protein n=1 Tax=Chitinophaga sp. LS1 TaxID=3051176 RepID=UPI002AAB1E3B|nr:PAS domain S-box protein [Chitinophaga sp. LS1]WPV65649.1 PAS domain S-box protein [Chitinophaga sp. LS1]